MANKAKERFAKTLGTDTGDKPPLPKIPQLPAALKVRYPELIKYEEDWERFHKELNIIREESTK